MERYTEYRNIIDTYLTEKAAAEEKAAKRAQELHEAIADAQSARQSAIDANDLKAYRAAQTAANAAQEQLDFISAGAGGPVKPNAAEFADGVHEEQAAILTSAKADAGELLGRLYDILTDAIKAISDGNKLLAEYDRKIEEYRRTVGSGTVHGIPEFTDHRDLVYIADAISSSAAAFEALTGHAPAGYETTQAKSWN